MIVAVVVTAATAATTARASTGRRSFEIDRNARTVPGVPAGRSNQRRKWRRPCRIRAASRPESARMASARCSPSSSAAKRNSVSAMRFGSAGRATTISRVSNESRRKPRASNRDGSARSASQKRGSRIPGRSTSASGRSRVSSRSRVNGPCSASGRSSASALSNVPRCSGRRRNARRRLNGRAGSSPNAQRAVVSPRRGRSRAGVRTTARRGRGTERSYRPS